VVSFPSDRDYRKAIKLVDGKDAAKFRFFTVSANVISTNIGRVFFTCYDAIQNTNANKLICNREKIIFKNDEK
jgi:hypothetical protein